jgi:hypothetical protein
MLEIAVAMPLYAAVFLSFENVPLVLEKIYERGSERTRATLRRAAPRLRAHRPCPCRSPFQERETASRLLPKKSRFTANRFSLVMRTSPALPNGRMRSIWKGDPGPAMRSVTGLRPSEKSSVWNVTPDESTSSSVVFRPGARLALAG